MALLVQLWLPIVLSALLVFILSALTHMMIPFRRTEWARIPEQDAFRSTLKDAAPGLYSFPSPVDIAERGKPEHLKDLAAGPSGFLTVVPRAPFNFGKNLGLSFAMNLFVSLVVAYVAAHALPAAASYRPVFRLVGTVGFLAYAVGTAYDAIWFWKPWRSVAMIAFESLLYGLAMAGTFGWLWHR